MNTFTDIFSLCGYDRTDLYKKIPKTFKTSLLATFIIGLAVHMFVYTNPIFGHDAAQLYWEPISFAQACSNTRWTVTFWQGLLQNIFQPWLCGFLTLAIYSFVTYIVCRIFEIERTLLIFFISGLLLTSPTFISSNLYLSSAYIYAAAMLFSVLSVYFYQRYKYGWILSSLFMFLCGGTYAGYVSVGLSMFLVSSILKIAFGKQTDFIKNLKSHIGYGVIFALSMLANAAVIKVFGGQGSVRGMPLNPLSQEANIVTRVINAYKDAVKHFSPLSQFAYFQQQDFYYALFLAVLALTVLCGIYVIIKKKTYKNLSFLILAFDSICLPLSINIIGIVAFSYPMTQGAYILPWLVIVIMYNFLSLDKDIVCSIKASAEKTLISCIYTLLVFGVTVVSISNNTVLANAGYTKAYANYEAGLALTNRFVDRIESIPGYVSGQTKVMFVGNPYNITYNGHNGGFDFCAALSGAWDTSLTFMLPVKAFITQELGVKMNIINGDYFASSQEVQTVLSAMDPSFAGIQQEIDALASFPGENCYIMKNDVVIFKIGEWM